MRKRDGWDELVTQKVEAALAPWVGLLPPEALEEFREQLEDFLCTHPVMERMVTQVLPAPVVAASGEVDASGAPVVEAPKAPTGTGTGRKR
jgi:hypothetical protein